MLWKTVVTHWKAIVIGLLIIWVAVSGKVASHYHDKYTEATQHLSLANATIKDMQTRQRDVATLDAKYTQELSDAQETIERLHSDVIAGRKRLQLNATCKNNSTTSSGMDDAASARLTDSAERDYFTIRQRIETVTKQLTGLQEYVTTQCLR